MGHVGSPPLALSKSSEAGRSPPKRRIFERRARVQKLGNGFGMRLRHAGRVLVVCALHLPGAALAADGLADSMCERLADGSPDVMVGAWTKTLRRDSIAP